MTSNGEDKTGRGMSTRAAARRNAVDGSALRALVVEDEFVISLAIETQLKALGCEVVGTAREAGTAIALGRELRPDVVFMDIGLAGSSGIDATRDLMREAPTCVIVVTAYADHRVQEALSAGASLVLTKPIAQEQLSAALAHIRHEREHAHSAPARGTPGLH